MNELSMKVDWTPLRWGKRYSKDVEQNRKGHMKNVCKCTVNWWNLKFIETEFKKRFKEKHTVQQIYIF